MLSWLSITRADEPAADANFFARGRTTLALAGGYGSFNDRSYGVVGLGAGYYVWNGLEAGLDGEAWLGARPHMYSISPRVTYTFDAIASFHPYGGIFYKRTFYDSGYADINSVGGRAGITTAISARALLNAGLVYEHLYQCDARLYDNCSQVYPELGISFSY